MPERKAIRRAEQDQREGKAPTTQAGAFVREEIEHVRKGKHGARSTRQAIAIGLSKARKAGVKLPPPPKWRTSEKTRRGAEHAYRVGQSDGRRAPSTRRSEATSKVLKREGRRAASSRALSQHARRVASQRKKAA